MADDDLLAGLLLRATERKAVANEAGTFAAKADAIRSQLLPMQRELFDSPFKRISLLTPGRVGKTFTLRGRLFRRALTQRDSLGVYIGLTRAKAEQEIWSGPSGLVNLCEKLQLKEPTVKFNAQKLTFQIPSLGSTIMCGGADDMKTIETYRGGPGYDEVWIDEAKSHSNKLLSTLIDDILVPRVNSRNGVLGLGGTPGSDMTTMFYEITRPNSTLSVPFGTTEHAADSLKWSMHRWNLAMNTIPVPETGLSLWEMALRIKEENGWTDQNATWMREYLGLWAADATDFVYRFRPYDDDGKEWNTWTPKEKTSDNPFGLPQIAKLPTGDARIRWMFAVALDLGSVDPCMVGVYAFAKETKAIFHVHEWYGETLDIGTIARKLDEAVKLVQKYADYPVAIVGDTAGLGETILKEILLKVGHRVTPAEKKDKFGFIGLANDDLIDGRMKILKGSVTAQHLAQLQWDASGKLENKGQRNEGGDVMIYARGAIISYTSRVDPVADVVKTPQELEHEAIFEKKPTFFTPKGKVFRPSR